MEYFTEGYPLFEKVESQWGMAQCVNGLATAAYEESHPEEAKEKFAQALQLFKAVGNLTGEGNLLALLKLLDANQLCSLLKGTVIEDLHSPL